jgi:hypothetical protein
MKTEVYLQILYKYSSIKFHENPSSGTNVGLHVFCKGKAIPLQAWTGPEGSRRLRLPDFKTIDT